MCVCVCVCVCVCMCVARACSHSFQPLFFQLAITRSRAQGEYAAAFANVRALSVIGAPLLYSAVYARTAPQGKGGYAFYASALTVVLAEFLHRSLSDKECYPQVASDSESNKSK